MLRDMPGDLRGLYSRFVIEEVKASTTEPFASAVEDAGGGDWSVTIRPVGADVGRRMMVCLAGMPEDDAESVLRDAARRLLTDAAVKRQPL